jgi:hypothetical protein
MADDNNGRLFNKLYNQFFGNQSPTFSDVTNVVSHPFGTPTSGNLENMVESLQGKDKDLDTTINKLLALKAEEQKAIELQGYLAGHSQQQIENASSALDIYIEKLTELQKKQAKVSAFGGMGGGSPTTASPGGVPSGDTSQLPPVQTNLNQTAEQQSVAGTGAMGKQELAKHHLSNLIRHPSLESIGSGVMDYYDRAANSSNPLIANAAKWGTRGAAVVGAAQAVPFALQGIERFYGNSVGQDIAYGQAAGLAGTQGGGAAASGLINRFAIEPINFLASALPGNAGIPFLGSPAAQFGAERRLEAFKAGFNPFDALSINEAQSVQREVQSRGYRAGSPQENKVIDSLFKLKNTTGMDPGQALDYIDIFVKKLGVGTDEIEKDLETFAESARAAGKSVNEYTKEVSAVAKSLVNSGVSSGNARAISQASAGIQGVSGEAVAGLANSQNPFFLQQALQNLQSKGSISPGDIALLMSNPAAALGTGEGGTTETSVNSLKSAIDLMRKQFPDQSLENIAAIVQKQFPIPGMENMSPMDIVKIYEQGEGLITDEAREKNLQELSKAYDDTPRIPNALAGFQNYDPKVRAKRAEKGAMLDELYGRYKDSVNQSYANKELTQEQLKEIQDRIKRREDPRAIDEDLKRMIGENRGEAADKKATAQVMLDASPLLKKYFTLIEQKDSRNKMPGSLLRQGHPRNKVDPRDITDDPRMAWLAGGAKEPPSPTWSP